MTSVKVIHGTNIPTVRVLYHDVAGKSPSGGISFEPMLCSRDRTTSLEYQAHSTPYCNLVQTSRRNSLPCSKNPKQINPPPQTLSHCTMGRSVCELSRTRTTYVHRLHLCSPVSSGTLPCQDGQAAHLCHSHIQERV